MEERVERPPVPVTVREHQNQVAAQPACAVSCDWDTSTDVSDPHTLQTAGADPP
jgi:hypothetical protein